MVSPLLGITRDEYMHLGALHRKEMSKRVAECSAEVREKREQLKNKSFHTEKTMKAQTVKAKTSKAIEKVPAAKFNMFDEVYFEGERLTIVGMKLITPVYALIFDRDCWGWHYELSPIFGASPEEVVGISTALAEGHYDVHESDLCPTSRKDSSDDDNDDD